MGGGLVGGGARLGVVTTFDPPFRIATITGYLADMDSLLVQHRFAGDRKAGKLREQIRVFTAAACPAAPAAAPGQEDRGARFPSRWKITGRRSPARVRPASS